MTSTVTIVALLAVVCISFASAGVTPVLPAAAYVNAVPYNVPPHASRVDVVQHGLAAPYVSAPYVSSPYVASPYFASPYVASPYAAPYSPYVAAPAGFPALPVAPILK